MPVAISPCTADFSGTVCGEVIRVLGLWSLSPRRRVNDIFSLPITAIMQKPARLRFRPMVDGEKKPYQMTFSVVSQGSGKIYARSWMKDLIIWDCQFDVSLSLVLRRKLVALPRIGRFRKVFVTGRTKSN